MTSQSPLNQQVEVTLKLTLWLDATLDEDEIVTHVRASLPKAFGDELTAVQNPVDILDVRQEANIFGNVSPQPGEATSSRRLLASLITCANLLADYDESEGEEGDAYREAIAAIAETQGRAA